MPSVASLAAKAAAMPPQTSPSNFGQIDMAALLGPSYATMREAFGLHQPHHGYAGQSIAAVTMLLGGSLPALAPFGQIDATIRELAHRQHPIATMAGDAMAASAKREAYGISRLADSISKIDATSFTSGISSATAAIKLAAVSQVSLPDTGIGFGRWADSLTRLTQDIARLGAIDSPPILYQAPTIHIRRAPVSSPIEEEHLLIAPERRGRRLGRPRGSYQCSPELVISTYKRLAESGRYITQEELARALGVEPRTLQSYLSPRRMGLGWPLKI